ncbi:threonine aldolase family protein [Lacipirellula limnantheis]|uniref:L-threonine aldolase n=1 Tax=Lacipirellula limnantheis TaxID=2528024 RepID=A0A517TVB1_9BACT|nr:low specificity L-threonine aldolase [Lacipirellula limnantheis]QDT72316.1 Low specificity L-threonine aldolase [Lacipirellula limnantheis]
MASETETAIKPGCQFASDNTAGACPEALQAFVEANAGSQASYGNDRYTTVVADRLRELFAADCDVYFVFNGTAANSLAVSTCCQPYHSVICSDVAHLETDECGGPEFFSGGAKLLLAGSTHGKLNVASVEELVTRRTDIHYPKPHVLSITQSTEMGTVYSLKELAQLGAAAKRLGLRVHMDGARFANAVASLDAAPGDIIRAAQVDVLCFGGAKIGLPVGEAVLFFDRRLAADFAYRCKQAGQLASKMRFLTAPWLGLLSDSAWLKHARHGNAMAARLAAGLSATPGVDLLHPPDANAVFASLPAAVHQRLNQRGWRYYTFIGLGSARFMCSWATTTAEVDALLHDIRSSATRQASY